MQYRIAQKDAPAPDPHRESLTVAAFEEYLGKGLGKAVVLCPYLLGSRQTPPTPCLWISFTPSPPLIAIKWQNCF